MKTTMVKLVCPQLSEQALRTITQALTHIIHELYLDKQISSTSHSIEYEDVPEDEAIEPDGTQPSSHEANVPDGSSQKCGLTVAVLEESDTKAHGAIVPDGPQPSSDHQGEECPDKKDGPEESDKEAHGAIVPAGSQPSSHHQGEECPDKKEWSRLLPDPACSLEDRAKPLWDFCLNATRRLHRYHWKTKARFIRGRPNRMFREARQMWKRLPMMIVSKEEKLRVVKKNLKSRDHMRKLRSLLSWDAEMQMKSLQQKCPSVQLT